MEEEWGPWIEWGCAYAIPEGVFVGDWYEGLWSSGIWVSKRVEHHTERNWSVVVRFRIRRPKALRELIDMVENLPVNAKEDA
jgi:hypothetical protein